MPHLTVFIVLSLVSAIVSVSPALGARRSTRLIMAPTLAKDTSPGGDRSAPTTRRSLRGGSGRGHGGGRGRGGGTARGRGGGRGRTDGSPPRDKRTNAAIAQTPSPQRRRQNRRRGGNRGKGTKDGGPSSPGSRAASVVDLASPDSAAVTGPEAGVAGEKAGVEADRAGADRGTKKKRGGDEDADSMLLSEVSSLDLSNLSVEPRQRTRAGGVTGGNGSVPATVDMTHEEDDTAVSPPSSPIRAAKVRAASNPAPPRYEEVSDDGKGETASPAHEPEGTEAMEEEAGGDVPAGPTTASASGDDVDMANAEEEVDHGAEERASPTPRSDGEVATPLAESRRRTTFDPSVFDAPSATGPTDAEPTPQPTETAVPPEPDDIQGSSVLGGLSSFGDITISSAQLEDFIQGRRLDDEMVSVLLFRAQHKHDAKAAAEHDHHEVVVWKPSEAVVFARTFQDTQQAPFEELASALEFPHFRTKAAFRGSAFNIKLITALNDRMLHGSSADEDRHWSYYTHQFATRNGSGCLLEEVRHYDSDGAERSAHAGIALTLASGLHAALESFYHQSKWTSSCKTVKVNTVPVPRQVGGMECAYYLGGFAEMTVSMNLFGNSSQHKGAAGRVNPSSITRQRYLMLKDILESIHGADSPIVSRVMTSLPSLPDESADADPDRAAPPPPSAPPSPPPINRSREARSSPSDTPGSQQAPPPPRSSLRQSKYGASATAQTTPNPSSQSGGTQPADQNAPRSAGSGADGDTAGRKFDGFEIDEDSPFFNRFPKRDPTAPPLSFTTAFIERISGIRQEDRYFQGLKHIVSAVTKVDPTARFHSLFQNQAYPPLSKADDVPADSDGLNAYFLASNPNSLVEQKGINERTGKRRENGNIYGTMMMSSEVDPAFLADHVNTGLAAGGVQCKFAVKAIQQLDVGSNFALVCVHHQNCRVGIGSVMRTLLEEQEKRVRKNDSKYAWPDEPLPAIHVVLRGLRDVNIEDNSVKIVNVRHDMSYVKRSFHFDSPTTSWPRLTPLFQALIDKGYIQKYFGRGASLLPISKGGPPQRGGHVAPQTETDKRAYQGEITAHMYHNMMHKVTLLRGLTDPNLPVKIEYQDGTSEPRTSCVRAVIMTELEVWETEERLKKDWFAEAVLPINGGPNSGSSYLTHFDDRVGAIVARDKVRKTEGPVLHLAKKMQGDLAGPWLYCYMLHELKYTLGTVESMMMSFSDAVRAMCDEAEWDEKTWTVKMPFSQDNPSSFAQLSHRMQNRGVNVTVLDMSQLLSDKKTVDAAAAATDEVDEKEREAMEKLMRDNRLYTKPSEKRRGASGASVRTGTSDADISQAPSNAKSTATENLRDNYVKVKVKAAKTQSENAALRAKIAELGLDPDEVLASNADDMSDVSADGDDRDAVNGTGRRVNIQEGVAPSEAEASGADMQSEEVASDGAAETEGDGDEDMGEQSSSNGSGRAASSEAGGASPHEM